jgi:SAM-dependent methyltransferase
MSARLSTTDIPQRGGYVSFVPKAEVLPFEPKLNKDRFAIAKNQSPGEGMIEIGATMSVSSTFTATDGDRYEIQMGRWSRRLSEPFPDFTGVGDDLLDAGCGTGSLTFAIPKRAKIQAAVGVDIAPAYIDHARRISTDDRLEFHVGDGCDIQYPDKSFDRVLSLLVLMFVPQPQKMIAEMCRVARPALLLQRLSGISAARSLQQYRQHRRRARHRAAARRP